MSENREHSMPRAAFVLVIRKATEEAHLGRVAKQQLHKLAVATTGVTVNAYDGRYRCPLRQMFGVHAEKIQDSDQRWHTFQSEFDWLMDEYFERSLSEHGHDPYEVKITNA